MHSYLVASKIPVLIRNLTANIIAIIMASDEGLSFTKNYFFQEKLD